MADVKGYMTVEASFIIPWVIFIFIFIIYRDLTQKQIEVLNCLIRGNADAH